MLKKLLFPVCASLLLFSCCKPDTDDDGNGVVYDPTPVALPQPAGFPPFEIPADNPLTKEGIALGRLLFYDPVLSGDNTLACAGCHSQANAFADPRRFSRGIDGSEGTRNAMALFNLAYPSSFFWDGRAKTLEDQILQPVENPVEMHEQWPNAVSEIQADKDYPKLYFKAFGDSTITKELTAKAIAQFLRTFVSTNSRYDKFLRGELFGTDHDWTESEERGLDLFMKQTTGPATGADCFHCHGNILFQEVDPTLQYRNNGLQEAASVDDFTDKGRGDITHNPQDNGKFKVPSLRNLMYTAPYMHDGRFTTIEQVVNFYSDSLRHSPTVDPLMEGVQMGGVHLTPQQKEDLVNFLKALSDPDLVSNPDFANPF